jgi:hypothetical protein
VSSGFQIGSQIAVLQRNWRRAGKKPEKTRDHQKILEEKN